MFNKPEIINFIYSDTVYRPKRKVEKVAKSKKNDNNLVDNSKTIIISDYCRI